LTLPRILATSIDGLPASFPGDEATTGATVWVGCLGLENLLDLNRWRLLLETELGKPVRALVVQDALVAPESLFPRSRHVDTFVANEVPTWEQAHGGSTAFACLVTDGQIQTLAVGPPIESTFEPFLLAVRSSIR
jgi:hypothetical protein